MAQEKEYLHDVLTNPFAKKELAKVIIPNCLSDNLKQKFEQRPYQVEAFKRFIYLFNEDFELKPQKPLHLLYNMATGSGKTLIMAGLILYLYEKGYRNFLFFVNSNNIIKKTKDNFLNTSASKYLFNDKIVAGEREIYIKETETFETSDENNINIKFTTIQKLHEDLEISLKENSVTYEDFGNKKIVLIADEAHHLNTGTKSRGELFGSWENTVLKILRQNHDNILLEFTATLDYESKEIAAKYRDKVIYKYDLAQFRGDKYSKEINLIRSQYDERERILQALVLNLYRQELANRNNINLKPVILFKAKKTIKESEQNKIKFHNLVDNLDAGLINEIKNTSGVPIVQKAFVFFDKNNITAEEITKRIKSNFRSENCISANNDEEAELNQIRLNTLEDENNPVRAIFAVQKLNEGWDVLNLFDIVRLYETRDGKGDVIGATTLAEAQLIGRGARYFPFTVDETQDKFTRKYDDDFSNDLKILEELYYHTKEDSRYISELKRALIESGIYEDEENLVTKHLRLKKEFRQTEFYKSGQVIFNRKVLKQKNKTKLFTEFGVSKKDFIYKLSSGSGKMSGVFIKEEESSLENKSLTVKLSEMPEHVIRSAIARHPFFYFDSLQRHYPELQSTSDFIQNESFLGHLKIEFAGPEARLENISNRDYLLALQGLLQNIETEIKLNSNECEGSDYVKDYVHNVFKDKEIKVYKGSEREDGQEDLVANEPWYAYNANYGTDQEKAFVAMFAKKFENLKEKFTDIYLLRNEREVKIIDKKGRAFEPDFFLFCKRKSGEELTYQVLIESKGGHLIPKDKWKEDYLNELNEEKKIIKIHTDKYVITGVPFYNYNSENDFIKSLETTLDVQLA